MWTRLTHNAKLAVLNANTLAVDQGLTAVSGQCLLYGVLCVPESTGYQILAALGFDPDTVQKSILVSLPSPVPKREKEELSLDESGMRLINSSYDFKELWKDSSLGTEHLLAAAVFDPNPPFSDLFEKHEITEQEFWNQLRERKPLSTLQRIAIRIDNALHSPIGKKRS
jgi:ATP-dependent Clp protease ATP-binding subunit ClpA